MASSQNTMDYLLDVLSDSHQVSSRRMFGEFCLYYAGRPVGLVCDDQLFLKPTEPGQLLMKDLVFGAPFPGARPHLLISADLWDDRVWMNRIVRATFDSLPPPKPPAAPRAKKVPAGSAGIQSLANLGPKSREMLEAAGIRTVAQLRKLGAVAAYAKVKQRDGRASLNLLWALEGALTDLPWQTVAHEHRTSLLLALEQYQSEVKRTAPNKPKKK
ncbi:TfoX/Sxy family DNA transformation protein [Rhodoferax sp. GW822-FHT02A01]|uniref:TfoX/Sxy family DNA transformation protein n=1 Tax=Rhodoferax sp. GW822-FHT02A01 TaxID=3141537 RepID=UPI00315CBAF9